MASTKKPAAKKAAKPTAKKAAKPAAKKAAKPAAKKAAKPAAKKAAKPAAKKAAKREMVIVYILINEAFPKYVKIGKTENLKNRMKQLDTTGVPLPFECYYAVEVLNSSDIEKHLHHAFDTFRVRGSREFFEMLPENAKAALMISNGRDVTPNEDVVETEADQRALDKARKQRESFKFSLLNIPPGTILKFSKDPNETCKVLDDKFVEFRGKQTSLSASALTIIRELGYDWIKVSGPAFWQYKGKGLYDLRLECDV